MTRPESAEAAGRAHIGKKAQATLLHEMDRRLRAYALVASAGGVGWLALAQPANAQVVYTPANISISEGDLFLHLNCGQKVNFRLSDRFEFPSSSSYGGVRELAINGSANASVLTFKHGAAALQAGSVIGSSRSFRNVYRGELEMAEVEAIGYSTYAPIGNWAKTPHGYLGLKFNINGQAHYGWAEMKVAAWVDQHNGFHIVANLIGYAYESTPNKSIQAGQKKETDEGATLPEGFRPRAGTLGALAQGAANGHCPDFEPHNSNLRTRPRVKKPQP
jgi:hypothetical protein